MVMRVWLFMSLFMLTPLAGNNVEAACLCPPADHFVSMSCNLCIGNACCTDPGTCVLGNIDDDGYMVYDAFDCQTYGWHHKKKKNNSEHDYGYEPTSQELAIVELLNDLGRGASIKVPLKELR